MKARSKAKAKSRKAPAKKAPAKKLHFTVDRTKWVCGDNSHVWDNPSELLNNAGNMCCLGQIMKQCGFKKAELQNYPSPADALSATGATGGGFLVTQVDDRTRNTALATRAMRINDHASLTKAAREIRLKELFARNNVVLTFKGRLARLPR